MRNLQNSLGEEKIVKERQEEVKGSSLTSDCDGANAHEQDRGCLGEGRDGGSW